MNDNEKWNEYNKQTMQNPPRPLLIKVFELLGGFYGKAIEIGCGSGIDSIFLIKRNRV